MHNIRFRSSDPSLPPGARALGLLFFAVGSVFAGGGLVAIGRVIETARWIVAPARVLESEIERHAGDQEPYYTCRIRYTFRSGGRTFWGNRLEPTEVQETLAEAVADRDAYPAGSRVLILHDPDRPNRCCIRVRFRWLPWCALAMGMIAAATGLGIVSGRLRLDDPVTSNRCKPSAPSPDTKSRAPRASHAPPAPRARRFPPSSSPPRTRPP